VLEEIAGQQAHSGVDLRWLEVDHVVLCDLKDVGAAFDELAALQARRPNVAIELLTAGVADLAVQAE